MCLLVMYFAYSNCDSQKDGSVAIYLAIITSQTHQNPQMCRIFFRFIHNGTRKRNASCMFGMYEISRASRIDKHCQIIKIALSSKQYASRSKYKETQNDNRASTKQYQIIVLGRIMVYIMSVIYAALYCIISALLAWTDR